MKRAIGYLARGLSVLFIGFISLFALDVFGESQWLLALLIHLIPSYILTAAAVIAWKKPMLGGWVYLGLGIMWLFISRGTGWILAAPALVIAGLFLVAGKIGLWE